MNKRITIFATLSALTTALALPRGAAAQTCPTTAAVFVFDQSGSMEDPGSTGAPKFEIALEKAMNDYNALPSNAHIGIIGFGNPPPLRSEPYMTTYVDLALGRTKAANGSTLVTQITTAAQPGNFNTPLAGAACDALDAAFTAKPECLLTTVRQVYIYSDGLENSTPTTHPCYSEDSSDTPFNPLLAGSGFGLVDDSWEWKVANKAWTGIPNVEDLPGAIHIVTNVSLLFDFVNSLSSGQPGAFDGPAVGADLQSVDANGVAFFSGLAKATNGSYFEAKKVNGVATKLPVPGDTDPTPTTSCVNAADVNRVVTALNRTVRANDPNFSQEDLAKRDVNNDLKVDALDYQVVLANYGRCS
jgi:hypothetical protein